MSIFEDQALSSRRTVARSGSEIDATEHGTDLVWNHGQRAKIKRSMRRHDRRAARQILRSAI